MNAFAPAQLAAHDGTEEDIFLHRGRRIIAFRVEELDRRPQILRETFGESAPRLQDPRLYFLVDQVERVARGNQLERHRQEPLTQGLQQAVDTGRLHPLQDAFEDRQIVSAEKAERLEELVLRPQTGE